jgi:hypothetical protein
MLKTVRQRSHLISFGLGISDAALVNNERDVCRPIARKGRAHPPEAFAQVLRTGMPLGRCSRTRRRSVPIA